MLIMFCSNTIQGNNQNIKTKVGWMHGNCLAIKNPDIKLPQDITLVYLEEVNVIGKGVVTQKARTGGECYAQLEDRRQANRDNGYDFYLVDSTKPINLAVGILGETEQDDFNFSSCNTTEGINFSISKKDAVIWQGYYYLGYESEATCEQKTSQ